MKEICDRIVSGGGIIVSAFDNAGAYSYPAILENCNWYGGIRKMSQYS